MILYFGRVVTWDVVCLLSQCNRRLNAILKTNHVWYARSKHLAEFEEVKHKYTFEKSPEFFWKTWYLNRMIRSAPIYAPVCMGVTYNGSSYSLWLPVVGSLITKPKPPSRRRNGDTNIDAFVVIAVYRFRKGQNKGVVDRIIIAPTFEPIGECLEKRTCTYNLVKKETLKFTKTGCLNFRAEVLDASFYTQ